MGISHSKSTNRGGLAPTLAQYPLDWKKFENKEKKKKKKKKKTEKKENYRTVVSYKS